MNDVMPTRVSREELYAMVWSTPVTILSQKYGLSDVGFAKICRKLKVPLPPRGSWEKLRRGYKVKKPPLYKPSKDTPLFYVIGKRPTVEPSLKVGEPEEIISRIRKEAESICAFGDEISKGQLDEKGPFRMYTAEYLEFNVSPELEKRAVFILNTVIYGVLKYGGKITSLAPGHQGVINTLSFFDEELRFSIIEEVFSYDYIPNRKEVKKHPRGTFPQRRYESTGKLRLCFSHPSSRYVPIRQTWSDQTDKKVEKLVPNFLIAAVKAAVHIRDQRREEEERERLRKIEQQRLKEIETQKELERRKIQLLEEQAVKWDKADRLKKLIKHIEEQAADRHPSGIPVELVSWLEWAKDYAEKIDPTMVIIEQYDSDK